MISSSLLFLLPYFFIFRIFSVLFIFFALGLKICHFSHLLSSSFRLLLLSYSSSCSVKTIRIIFISSSSFSFSVKKKKCHFNHFLFAFFFFVLSSSFFFSCSVKRIQTIVNVDSSTIFLVFFVCHIFFVFLSFFLHHLPHPRRLSVKTIPIIV